MAKRAFDTNLIVFVFAEYPFAAQSATQPLDERPDMQLDHEPRGGLDVLFTAVQADVEGTANVNRPRRRKTRK